MRCGLKSVKSNLSTDCCISQINIFHHFQYEEDDLPLGSVCPLARVRVCSGWYEELNSFAPVLLPSSHDTLTLVLSFRLVTTIIPSSIIVKCMQMDTRG